jgi:hypothetical protein
MRRTAGYTRLGYKTNLGIMKELNTQSVMKFIKKIAELTWKNHFLGWPAPNSPLPKTWTNIYGRTLQVTEPKTWKADDFFYDFCLCADQLCDNSFVSTINEIKATKV